MTDAVTRVSSHVPVSGLGDRVRALRLSAGLTQTQLAGGRCTKEYVSQIERGKTRPTPDTIEWMAAQLGVDPDYLATGVSAEKRDRVEAALLRAEALTIANDLDDALEAYRAIAGEVAATGSKELELRVLVGNARVLVRTGDARAALELLQTARAIAEGPVFSDIDRADVVFRLGICRYNLSSIATAVALFDEALALAERSGMPCDLLRADILQWRSRCRRRQRDFEAAREDAELALELARASNDRRMQARSFFQASLVAERLGKLVLARTYAQQAKDLYTELEDEQNVGRLMLNLGGLQHLLGKSDEAIEHLTSAFALSVEAGSKPEAAQAVSGLATVYLRRGDYEAAEENARKALELLDGREDFLGEIGQCQLTLGEALMERGLLDEAGKCFRAADGAFEQYASVGHRAGAWVALGDLAGRRGDDREAARHYRNAAEALRDIRF
jgi:tetratricopeptide (TPR) repeat protein